MKNEYFFISHPFSINSIIWFSIFRWTSQVYVFNHLWNFSCFWNKVIVIDIYKKRKLIYNFYFKWYNLLFIAVTVAQTDQCPHSYFPSQSCTSSIVNLWVSFLIKFFFFYFFIFSMLEVSFSVWSKFIAYVFFQYGFETN